MLQNTDTMATSGSGTASWVRSRWSLRPGAPMASPTSTFGSSSYAAKVNGHTISLDDAHNAWQRAAGSVAAALRRHGAPAGRDAPLQDQLLETLVRNTLIPSARTISAIASATRCSTRPARRTGLPARWPVLARGRSRAGAGRPDARTNTRPSSAAICSAGSSRRASQLRIS